MRNLTTFLTLLMFLGVIITSCGGSEETEGENTDTTAVEESDTSAEEVTEEDTSSEDEPLAMELSEEAKPFAKEWAMTSFTNTEGKSQEGIDNAFLTLGEDGKFVEKFSGNEIASGTWTIMKEGETQVLVLTHLTGEMASQLSEGKEKLKIKEFSADKMITVDDGGKMTETFTAVAAE